MCRFSKEPISSSNKIDLTYNVFYIYILTKKKLFHVMIIDELTYITIVTRCLDFITVLWMGNAR